jgi:hypothetical protein
MASHVACRLPRAGPARRQHHQLHAAGYIQRNHVTGSDHNWTIGAAAVEPVANFHDAPDSAIGVPTGNG